MSSVLHPVGPEPEQTYWVRRALVIASAVLLVALVIALVVGGTSTGSAVSADPAPPVVAAPAPLTPTPSPWATPTASPSPSGSAAPSGTASPSATPSSSAGAATSAVSPSPEASETSEKSPSPSAKPTKAAPAVCAPEDLRTTLTGKQRLEPEQDSTFHLSLINGSDDACRVEVDADSFELKIYSGTDRIWSSDDCAKAVRRIAKKVQPEDAVEWTMRWDGTRSRGGCKDRPEVPRAGTYFATAQLEGAEPVQLRMILRD